MDENNKQEDFFDMEKIPFWRYRHELLFGGQNYLQQLTNALAFMRVKLEDCQTKDDDMQWIHDMADDASQQLRKLIRKSQDVVLPPYDKET